MSATHSPKPLSAERSQIPSTRHNVSSELLKPHMRQATNQINRIHHAMFLSLHEPIFVDQGKGNSSSQLFPRMLQQACWDRARSYPVSFHNCVHSLVFPIDVAGCIATSALVFYFALDHHPLMSGHESDAFSASSRVQT